MKLVKIYSDELLTGNTAIMQMKMFYQIPNGTVPI